MTTELTTAASLSVGDIIIDRDGLELRVLGIARKGRTLTLTLEFVEAGMLAAGPAGPTTVRVGVNSMVVVPAK